MTASTGIVRSSLATVEAAVAWVRSSLTEGQRWTSALALALASMVLFAGLPTAVTHVPGTRGEPVTATGDDTTLDSAPTAPSAGGAAAAARSRDQSTPSAPGPATVRPGAPVPASPDRVVTPGPATAPAPPDVVALVRRGDGPIDRDDAAMAAAYLARSGFDATIVPVGASSEQTCADALEAGSVIVASTALAPALERCLLDGGAAVVAFGRSTRTAEDAMVSTRRDMVDSLVDLARWGLAGGALDGRVGIVGGTAERDDIEAAVVEMGAAGVEVVDVAWVDPASPDSVTDGLRGFAAEGVEVAVLAAPMAAQRQWAAQQVVLLPGARTVVSDAFDAIVDESYPPSFDGAVAHTSLRVPWFARAEGETVTQERCREIWEESSQTMLGSEAVRAFAWCQHVAMVGEALRAGADFPRVLRALTVDSPLTSDLRPLPDGGFGPEADAALEWRAACSCWQPVRGFTPR